MRKPWCYIIGKVGDLSDDRYYEMVCLKFDNRKHELEALGYFVINPMEIVPRGTDWNRAMRMCINAMLQCSHVSPLSDYTESRGGIIEIELAKKLDFIIVSPSKMNSPSPALPQGEGAGSWQATHCTQF